MPQPWRNRAGHRSRFPLALGLVVFIAAATTHGTLWTKLEKTDPLTGQKVPAYGILSFGGYIYDWPSKYDLVFWPLTDPHYICFNPASGYGAFNPDFDTPSEQEKEALRKWLRANYDPSRPPKTHAEQLPWLEKLYRLRKMDDDFWCRFYRLCAYVYRDDPKKSLEYVQKALPLLQKQWKAKPEGIRKIETLYLLGEYNRRLGEFRKAQHYFAQAKTATYRDRDGKEKTGHPFISELIRDRESLPPLRKADVQKVLVPRSPKNIFRQSRPRDDWPSRAESSLPTNSIHCACRIGDWSAVARFLSADPQAVAAKDPTARVLCTGRLTAAITAWHKRFWRRVPIRMRRIPMAGRFCTGRQQPIKGALRSC